MPGDSHRTACVGRQQSHTELNARVENKVAETEMLVVDDDVLHRRHSWNDLVYYYNGLQIAV